MEITINDILQLLLICKTTQPETIIEYCLLKNIENTLLPTSEELTNDIYNTKICKLKNNELFLLLKIIESSQEVTDDLYNLYLKLKK